MSRLLALCAAVLVATGCGSDSISANFDARDTGVASFALSTTVGTATYSVVGATLEIVGPTTEPTTRTIVDISAPSITVPLKAGNYTVELKGTPQLALASDPNAPIAAELISPNPQSFTVGDNRETPVAFKFKPKTGRAVVGVAYSLTGGFIKGTATVKTVTTTTTPAASHVFDSLANQTLSFSATWEQAVASTQVDPTDATVKERVINIGSDLVPQFGGDDSVLSEIYGKPTRLNYGMAFGAKNGTVTLRYTVPLALVFGGTGPGGSHVAGNVDYGCEVFTRPIDLDLAAYGATIDAAGYPNANAVLAIPIELRCDRTLFYSDFGQLSYALTDKLSAEGVADLVPSVQP